jgi:hypothetical protein
MNCAFSDDTWNMDIEAFCVEMEGKGAFWVSGNFNQKRVEFWKWMNVRVVADLLRINDFDIDQFPEFDGLAKAACKSYISLLQAGAPQRGSNVQQDQPAAARPAPRAGGSSSSSSAAQSEVEQLRAQLRREKRKTAELQADKERLVQLAQRVGGIQQEWEVLNHTLRKFCHPNRDERAKAESATGVFQDVGLFTDHLRAVIVPAPDVDLT